ncbi:MAG: sulfur carrier protein ThiS [Tissierellales bacterium]
MILINGKEHEWSQELTIQRILDIKRYTFPKIIVKVNGNLIAKHEYAETLIHDGDEVQIIHLLAGG